MSDVWNLGLKLLLITAVAALALGFTNYLTEQPIADQRIKADMEARLAVLPLAKNFEKIAEIDGETDDNSEIQELYRGICEDKNIIGYTFKVLVRGFGGDMEVIVGINDEGNIEGVRLGNHSETPGLGAKAADEDFLGQFPGKSVEKGINVKKTEPLEANEVEALTGATITSEGVSDAINSAIRYFNKILEQEMEG